MEKVESYGDTRGEHYSKELSTNKIMAFEDKMQLHGELIRGFLPHWSRGDYKKPEKTKYFSIHWEIRNHRSIPVDTIHFHVESPKYEQDQILNDLKKKLIDDILADKRIEESFQGSPYRFSLGIKLSEESIRKNKSTGLFKLKLDEHSQEIEPWQEIVKAHMVAGELLDEAYMKIKPDIDKR